jgi:LytS/YehU family sensor histidine kinase
MRWVWILSGWTAFGLFNAAQLSISAAGRGAALPWWMPLVLHLPVAWTWALATPIIAWLGRRFPIERGRRLPHLALHVACAATLIVLTASGYTWHATNLLPATVAARTVAQVFLAWLVPDGLIYVTIVTVGWSLERQRQLQERERAAAQLEAQLARAQLQALQMQLHPHFLFNALHTIGSLVRTGDRANAVRVVTGLGDLLRRLLDGAAQPEMPLRDELAFVRAYLDVEQVRFPERLRARVDAADDVLDALVPPLILQPLVENAIRHGIAPHRAAGDLVVTARRDGAHLVLTVRDDGRGPNGPGNGARPGGGIGLANTRARLERLYGADFVLESRAAAGRGHEARIVVPLRTATAAAP